MTTLAKFPAGLAFGSLLALTAVPSQAAGQDNVVVVLNARNPTTKISVSELKNIYLGNTAFWHGVVPMRVVMRPTSSEPATVFLQDVLGLSVARYQQTWTSRQLSGQGMAPKEVGTPDQVASTVRSNPGAIGFLLASEAWDVPPEGVRVLQIDE